MAVTQLSVFLENKPGRLAETVRTLKENNINILEVDEHLTELSATLKSKIIPGFEEYGLTVPEFYLTTVVLPEEDDRKIKELIKLFKLFDWDGMESLIKG